MLKLSANAKDKNAIKKETFNADTNRQAHNINPPRKLCFVSLKNYETILFSKSFSYAK